MRAILLGIIVLLSPLVLCVRAEHHPERWYQNRWCADAGGRTEVVLPDGSRCDCVTATNAVEVDFGHKWAEAVGQSLHYGEHAHLRPGIALIIETPDDARGLRELRDLIQAYGLPIDVWDICQDLDQ